MFSSIHVKRTVCFYWDILSCQVCEESTLCRRSEVHFKAVQLFYHFFFFFISSLCCRRSPCDTSSFMMLVLQIENASVKAASINRGWNIHHTCLSLLPELLHRNVASSVSSCLRCYYGNRWKPMITLSQQKIILWWRGIWSLVNHRQYRQIRLV